MQLYRDLLDGEIIQHGDRMLTSDAGFQPVFGCIGKPHSTKNHFIIQRPVAADGHELEITGVPAHNINPIYIHETKTDQEVIARIIKEITWTNIDTKSASDMLNFLLKRNVEITLGDCINAIHQQNDKLDCMQPHSYRAAFNTDCIIKLLSNFIVEFNESKRKRPWYRFWSKS